MLDALRALEEELERLASGGVVEHDIVPVMDLEKWLGLCRGSQDLDAV
jgi:hypothetical protein